METLMKRLLASLTAGSLAFAAVPALAFNAGADGSLDTGASLMLSRCKKLTGADAAECERRVTLQLEARTNAEAKAENRALHGSFMSGLRSDARADVRHDDDVKPAYERMWKHAVSFTEKAVKRIGGVARKMCRAESDDSTAVAACMTRLKTSFKATVDAAIEASFSL